MKLQKDQHTKLQAALDAIWPHLSVLPVLPDLNTREDAEQMFFDEPREKGRQPGPVIWLNASGRERMTELLLVLRGFTKERVAERTLMNAVAGWLKVTFAENNWTKPNPTEELRFSLVDRVSRTMDVEEDYVVSLPVLGCWLPDGPFTAFGGAFVPASRSGLAKGFELLGFPASLAPEYLDDLDHLSTKDLFRAPVICMVRTTGAEREGAATDGLGVARDTLGVLNLVLHWTQCFGCRVALEADDLTAHRVVYTVSRTGKASQKYRLEGRADHKLGELVFPLSHKEHDGRLAAPWAAQVNALFRGVAEKRATSLDQQLVRMWSWLGRSYMSRNPGEKFLFNVVALECAFGLTKVDGKRQNLANYVSNLLETDPEEQRLMRSRVLRWYDARSSIVHAGEDAPTEVDCTAAEETIIKLAKTLVLRRSEWRSPNELRAALDSAISAKV